MAENLGKKNSNGGRAPRSKFPMELIKDSKKRHVVFSKRKSGLFKKSAQLCSLCPTVEIAVLVFSKKGNLFTFGNPNLDGVINRYLELNGNQEKTINVHENNGGDCNRQGLGLGFWWDSVNVDDLSLEELEKFKSSLEDAKNRAIEMGMKVSRNNGDVNNVGDYSGVIPEFGNNWDVNHNELITEENKNRGITTAMTILSDNGDVNNGDVNDGVVNDGLIPKFGNNWDVNDNGLITRDHKIDNDGLKFMESIKWDEPIDNNFGGSGSCAHDLPQFDEFGDGLMNTFYDQQPQPLFDTMGDYGSMHTTFYEQPLPLFDATGNYGSVNNTFCEQPQPLFDATGNYGSMNNTFCEQPQPLFDATSNYGSMNNTFW